MRVLVIVKATEHSERRPAIDKEMMAQMKAFNDQLRDAGVFVCAEGLEPTSNAKRIQFANGKRAVTDGPFRPADDQIAGFWIWDVQNMEEAMHWANLCPQPMPGPCTIDIRPFYEHKS